MKEAPGGLPSAAGLRVAVISSAFNRRIVEGLENGARDALGEMGARTEDVEVVLVPGAFELPLAALAAARSGRFDAIVALGAVIRGETDHYEHVAREASTGLARVTLETGVPVGFGVLTVREEAHAARRAARGPDNKGAEAARAAVATARVLRSLRPAAKRTAASKDRAPARRRRDERPRRGRGGAR